VAFDDDGTRPSPTPTTPSSFRPTLVGIVVANRYRIERVATSGSSTVMVDATDIQLERPVTLKLVRPEISELPEFQRRFDQVMRSMTTLSHMNIAAVHDWGEDRIGGRVTVFAAVEYLGGGSLRVLLDRGRLLDASQALVVGLDACRALDYAHRRNLVHGELTPAKLVFGDDRRLRVVDFGLARLLGASAWREPATVGSHVARYASPEQALGQPIDAKTDVYALALSMIESVTGSVPFSADSTVATLSARIGKLTPVSADLGALASVLERAGRPDRNDRWTAAEFGRALIRAAERLPRPTPLPLVTAPAMRPEPTRRPTDPTGGVDRPGTARAGRPPGGPPAVVARTPAADPDPEPEPAVVAEPETAEPETADTQPVTGDIPLELVHVAPLQLESDRPAAPAAPVAPDVASEPEPDHLPVSPPPAADTTTIVAPAVGATPTIVTTRPDAPDADPSGETARYAAPPTATTPPAPTKESRRWWPRALVSLFLAVAVAAAVVLASLLLRTERHEVPDLIGLTEQRARAAVSEFDWEVQIRRERSDDEFDAGQVVRSSPTSGEQLAEGEPLFLVVSDGPRLRALPDVRGITGADARRRLERQRMEVSTVERVYDERVAPGSVVTWNVAGQSSSIAGDEVEPGTEIELALSRGPRPRTVPDLRTLSIAQARGRLEELGLELQLAERVFSNLIEEDLVVRQRPRIDSRVERGATVTVIVSKGRDLVTFPNLDGLNFRQAVRKLEESGLQRGEVLGSTQGELFRVRVDGAEAEAGDQIARNSEVDLVFL